MHINVSHVDLNDLLDWWKKTWGGIQLFIKSS
jgi:hypothetical protein